MKIEALESKKLLFSVLKHTFLWLLCYQSLHQSYSALNYGMNQRLLFENSTCLKLKTNLGPDPTMFTHVGKSYTHEESNLNQWDYSHEQGLLSMKEGCSTGLLVLSTFTGSGL